MGKGFMKICGWTMLVLYLGYYVSATSFYHIHYYKGEVIAHSHFYCLNAFGGAPAKEHRHTPAQFQTIALLTDLILACVPGFCLFLIFACKRMPYTLFRQDIVFLRLLAQPLRAPPLCTEGIRAFPAGLCRSLPA